MAENQGCRSHQEKVALHGRGVSGCQLEDVSLLDKLVGGVDDVLFFTEHLVDLDELLEVFLSEDDMFRLPPPLERERWLKLRLRETYRLSDGTVGVSSGGGDDF